MMILHKSELIQVALRTLRVGEKAVVVDSVETAMGVMKSNPHSVIVIEPLHYPNATEKLSEVLPVVVLTESMADRDVVSAIKAGASAYLHVSCSLQRLKATLKSVKKGSLLLNPTQASVIMTELERLRSNGAALSSRQLEVLELIVNGDTNPSIAKKLGISTASVAKAAWQLYEELEVTGGGPGTPRVKAAVLAVRLGLV